MDPRRSSVWRSILPAALVLSMLSAPGALAAASIHSPTLAPGGAPTHGAVHAAAVPTSAPLPIALGARPAGPAIVLSSALTIIYPDGTISNLSAPIVRNGTLYQVTANFTGGIEDECNGTTLDGQGHSLQKDVNLSFALAAFQATGVTIENFRVLGAGTGVLVISSIGALVQHDELLSTGVGVWVQASTGSTVAHDFFNASGPLVVENANATSILANRFHGLTSWGIEVVYSSLTILEQNHLGGASYDLYLGDSENISATANDFSTSYYGVYEYTTTGTTLTGNWFNASSYPIITFDSVSLQASGDHGSGAFTSVTLQADASVRLSGESLPGALLDGLDIEGSRDVVVADSNFSGAHGNGSYLLDSSNVSFSNVNLSGFHFLGVLANMSQGLNFSGVNASNPGTGGARGFLLNGDTGVSLYDSTADHTGEALVVNGGTGLRVFGSSLTGATYSEDVQLQYLGDATFEYDNLSGAVGSGVYSYGSGPLTFAHDTVTANAGDGLDLFAGGGAQVLDNRLLKDGGAGIYVASASGVTIEGNLVGFHGATVGYGIELSDLSNAVVSGNSINATSFALEGFWSSGVTAEGNLVTNSTYGLYLAQTEGSALIGNSVVNDSYAFFLSSNNGLTIYHNNFVRDGGWTMPASIQHITWDAGYPIGGNYWSNDTAPDLLGGPGQNLTGSDGIVDLPKELNVTNIDHFPLARAWAPTSITFTETGLAPGTSWGVTVNGHPISGVGANLQYLDGSAANTTISYTVAGVGGYSITGAGPGQVAMDGSNRTVAVTFAPFLYTVTFAESGLVLGTGWSVHVNAQDYGSSTTQLTLSLANGSYPYTVAPVMGYALTTPSGAVLVSAGAVTVDVTYVKINQGGGNNGTGNGTGGGHGNNSSGGGKGGGGNGGGNGGGSGSTPVHATGAPAASISTLTYGFIAGLIALAALAALGFALWSRERRARAPPKSVTSWSPPPVGALLAGVRPAAAGAGAASIASSEPVVGSSAPEWSEDPPQSG